jgi:two-component system, sensor histidine kinase
MSLRVLAAEDNLAIQLVLRTLLLQAGIDPTIVSNGAEAVDAWRDGGFDIILMDVKMPHMDGPSAASAIRRLEREQGRARTPIIALTGDSMSHQIEAYLAAGMDDHLAKPIEPFRLFELLASAGGERQNAA